MRRPDSYPHHALSPTVHSGVSMIAVMAEQVKTLFGSHQQLRFASGVYNVLIDYIDSAKVKIMCYSRVGHRGHPLDMFFL